MACQKSSSLLTLVLILSNLPGKYHQVHFERNRTSTTYKWIGPTTWAFIYVYWVRVILQYSFQLLVTLSMFRSDALAFFRVQTRHLHIYIAHHGLRASSGIQCMLDEAHYGPNIALNCQVFSRCAIIQKRIKFSLICFWYSACSSVYTYIIGIVAEKTLELSINGFRSLTNATSKVYRQ